MPIAAPIAIWNSGRGKGRGRMRETIPLTITANTRRRMTEIISTREFLVLLTRWSSVFV